MSIKYPPEILALIEVCKFFPTDSDMEMAGWSEDYIKRAGDAYDAAQEVIANYGGTTYFRGPQ